MGGAEVKGLMDQTFRRFHWSSWRGPYRSRRGGAPAMVGVVLPLAAGAAFGPIGLGGSLAPLPIEPAAQRSAAVTVFIREEKFGPFFQEIAGEGLRAARPAHPASARKVQSGFFFPCAIPPANALAGIHIVQPLHASPRQSAGPQILRELPPLRAPPR